MRVLVVEDHPDIAENIGDSLEEEGHEVDFALDGPTGLRLARAGRYDAMVLDLMLPRLDGLEVCRRLRQESGRDLPILMLTARDALSDKLKGFEAGADDYLVKPFALEELHARLAALTARGRSPKGTVLRIGDLELDRARHLAHRQGRELDLTPIGFELLRALMEASPGVVTKEQLSEAIWGGEPPQSDALRSHVYALRRQLDRPFDTPLLETVHGVGLRLGLPEDGVPGDSVSKDSISEDRALGNGGEQ